MHKFLVLISLGRLIFATGISGKIETQTSQNGNSQQPAVNFEIQENSKIHQSETEDSKIRSSEFVSVENNLWDIQNSENLTASSSSSESLDEDANAALILEKNGAYTYLCPPENQDDKNIQRELSNKLKHVEYCLFEKQFSDEEKKICQDEVKPILIRMKTRENEIKCYKSKLYSFAFLNCTSAGNLHEHFRNLTKRKDFPNESEIAIMYDICYDNSAKKTYWTRHIISFQKQLLEKYKKLDKRTKEKYLDMKYFGRKSQKEEFLDKISCKSYDLKGTLFPHMLMKFKQESASEGTTNRMIPHMLVPEEDLLVPLWMTTTNHMINMAPLWVELVSLMNAINNGIRNAAIIIREKDDSHYLEIYTRAFVKKNKSSKLPNFNVLKTKTTSPTKAFLHDDTRFPIPNIWCKFVYCQATKLGIMIFVHNTPEEIPQKDQDYCKGENRINCNFDDWSEEDKNIKRDINTRSIYAYCCKATEPLVEQIFKINKTIQSDLNIENILKDSRTIN